MVLAFVEALFLMALVKRVAQEDMDLRGAFVIALGSAITMAVLSFILSPFWGLLLLVVPAVGVMLVMRLLYQFDMVRATFIGIAFVAIHIGLSYGFAVSLALVRLAAGE